MSTGFVSAPQPRRAVDPRPLNLPPAPAEQAKASVSWLASAVPIVGALGFWALTGVGYALWFALLGPLIAAAGMLDGARTARRTRRDAAARREQARSRIGAELDERHEAEREHLRAQYPDATGYLTHPDRIWRPLEGRARALVVGSGSAPSSVRLAGGDEEGQDAELLRRARLLTDAPVVLPHFTGVAVLGPPVLARAVARALVLQLALARPPGNLAIAVGTEPEWQWARALPHAAIPAPVTLSLGNAGGAVPLPGELTVVHGAIGDALVPTCDVILSLLDAVHARVEQGAEVHEVRVEAVGERQAIAVAAALAQRAAATAARARVADEPISLAALPRQAAEDRGTGLPVAVGMSEGEPFVLDLVADGPHALVTGMTGSGKSELLVTWTLALCLSYPTREVSFLLADFKGGTAFDALAKLPHVTGVITDLDTRVARRAIESLRAEIRHRESVLARAGARDVAHADLPRLVIVIDEFAALRDTHPELESLFVDIAARGRALGMHLVVGTQRATGAVRDALIANCALRISLRVADPFDSRAVVGTDAAAALPGGPDGRGLAVVRRAADAAPRRLRVALSSPEDVDEAAAPSGPPPRRPWLPALPERVTLDELDRLAAPGHGETGLTLGLLDEPSRQRQSRWRLTPEARGLLIVGGAGAGKTTALHTLAAQVPTAQQFWVGPDAERAWDALMLLAAAPPQPGAVVLIDDLDALTTRLPGEYGREAAEAAERLVRGAGDLGIRVVASAQRLTGVAARLADLLPKRLVLATPSRAEHVAAGGEPGDYHPDLPPGRGVIDRRTLQVALAGSRPARREEPAAPGWEPSVGVTGFVVRRPPPELLARWERTGVRLRRVEDREAVPSEGRDPLVLVGDPEGWLSRPRLLAEVRGAHTLLIDAGTGSDYRLLTGERELPPYAAPGRGRAWVYRPAAPRRVALRGTPPE